ncbi:hypothetical protein TrLO_g7943 [Triparma laevis f. longispina]|uniref:Uncharacterized protein n=1 Tax=Triparma laevis f. longispina TaxID=1714387 RepID=A0A9W7KVM4_9STRA|nr:hypothetical protein TrLO_g7943 [Triparma laevis f. longispina]
MAQTWRDSEPIVKNETEEEVVAIKHENENEEEVVEKTFKIESAEEIAVQDVEIKNEEEVVEQDVEIESAGVAVKKENKNVPKICFPCFRRQMTGERFNTKYGITLHKIIGSSPMEPISSGKAELDATCGKFLHSRIGNTGHLFLPASGTVFLNDPNPGGYFSLFVTPYVYKNGRLVELTSWWQYVGEIIVEKPGANDDDEIQAVTTWGQMWENKEEAYPACAEMWVEALTTKATWSHSLPAFLANNDDDTVKKNLEAVGERTLTRATLKAASHDVQVKVTRKLVHAEVLASEFNNLKFIKFDKPFYDNLIDKCYHKHFHRN